MTTRYLCLSGTHLGPVAERSCIFCINAVAVADRHLTETMWRQGLQSLVQHSHMFICLNSGQWGTHVKCSGPGVDTVCFGKKRDIPLPYFLSTRVMMQGGLCHTRECKDNGTYFSLPTQSTKWSCCFELLSGLESCFVKSFLRQGVLQVCFVSWLSVGSAGFLLQGGSLSSGFFSQVFDSWAGKHIFHQTLSIIKGYSKGKPGKGSHNPINFNRITQLLWLSMCCPGICPYSGIPLYNSLWGDQLLPLLFGTCLSKCFYASKWNLG